MIRINLAKLHADLCFVQNRKIEWRDIAEQTGIHRVTLSKMLNQRGYNATLSNVDRLCHFFNCGVTELLTYVPDEELTVRPEMSRKGPEKNSVPAKAGPAALHKKKRQSAAKD